MAEHYRQMVRVLVSWSGLVNDLHTRACGASKGYGVACVAGNARNTRNTIPEKAREVGLAQEKTNNSQALVSWCKTLDRFGFSIHNPLDVCGLAEMKCRSA
jgi:hypothetical protein